MAQLIFCLDRTSLDAWTSRFPENDKPFLLTAASDIRGAIQALHEGQNVVALAQAAATGWRAPEGTEVVLDAKLEQDTAFAALAAQCRSRAPVAFGVEVSAPTRERILSVLRDKQGVHQEILDSRTPRIGD
ncbi:hypothetical protein LAZ40_03180 [Cereibacter sphaeroides]|uniref:hypothetical protein n=1 Tax=Cereibacter sphaeroides TaxID=1063 RepID=UPI001F18191C|nr:hypothetical protein [Cereibacter sphaeroides]MCE6958058.1 hypothetical protein [Cereibacter sphaeroides]MCE6971349.1 hypothetical protein [Cereibacter sphaeroides]